MSDGNVIGVIKTNPRPLAFRMRPRRLRLMERLDIHDVPGLVRFAIRAGLVSPE